MKKIKVIAIIGKAGSGKDSILSRFRNYVNDIDNKNYHFVIPFTTRPMRPGEQEGREYYFKTDDEIEEIMNDITGPIIQVTEFNNWKYGFFNYSFQQDKINIGIFTPTAISQLMVSNSSIIDFCVIYINARDKDRLLRQLNREEDPDVYEIFRRFNEDNIDFRPEILGAMPHLVTFTNNNREDLVTRDSEFMAALSFLLSQWAN